MVLAPPSFLTHSLLSKQKDLFHVCDVMDFEKKKKKMVLTFDAIMARQNFIFVFDILTIGGESGGSWVGGQEGGFTTFKRTHKT